MKYAIIAAKTGNGHLAVMNTIKKQMESRKINVECYPDFYESILYSNKILSDFYNFLLTNSLMLCNKYCEFTSITRYDLSEDFYIGAKEYLTNFLLNGKYDVIISVSHTINHVMCRIIKELGLATKYYIIVTDPFDPIAVGYVVEGADRYYCTNYVKDILLKHKIPNEKICVSGYPIDTYYKRNNISSSRQIKKIFLNSGSQGNNNYFNILTHIIQKYKDSSLSIRMICGKNKILYKRCLNLVRKQDLEDRIELFEFVENLYDQFNDVDLIIGKPGANSFFEAVYCGIPQVVDATECLIYQEKGVKKFLNEYKVGYIASNLIELDKYIDELLYTDNFNKIKKNIEKYDFHNGTKTIVEDILSHNLGGK